MKRLLSFVGVRETPAGLLAKLREIDPDIEFVAVKPDTWWLGSVSRNEIRREMGERILANEARRAAPNPMNVILGKLTIEGFARIQSYSCNGNPETDSAIDADGNFVPSILADFRERHFNWTKDQGAEIVKRRAAISAGQDKAETAEALLRDKLLTDGRAEFRRVNTGRIITFGR